MNLYGSTKDSPHRVGVADRRDDHFRERIGGVRLLGDGRVLAPPSDDRATVTSACVAGLERLSGALGLGHDPRALALLVRDVLGSGGDVPLDAEPAPSDLSDDGSPFEYSVDLESGKAELRFLVEAQGRPASQQANWQAACGATARLAERWGASTERFDRIAGLFAPRDPSAFSAQHAFCLRAGSDPLVKMYLDPKAGGARFARRTVASALSELGMDATWGRVSHVLDTTPSARLAFFSLDLSPSPDARVKVYLAHECATADEFAAALAVDGSRTHLGMADVCRALTGGTGPYVARPLISCFSFTSSDPSTPRAVTAYVPVRSYVWNDEIAANRLYSCLPSDARRAAKQAVEAAARRSLASGRGLIAYVSMREDESSQRFTVYLSAEAYSMTPAIAVRRTGS